MTTSSGKKVPSCLPMLVSTLEFRVELVKVVDEVEVLSEAVDVAMLALFVDIATFILVIVICFGNAVTGCG